MTPRDTIDRRAVLATGIAAWSAVTLGGCSDDAGSGGTGGAGAGGGAGTGGAAGMNTAGSSAGTGAAGGPAGAGAGGDGSPLPSFGGTGNGGLAGGGMGGAGTGGTGETAGMGGAAPPPVCTADVSKAGTGMHTHPLTVPGSDVAQGYPSVDYYILEDGGTGHTHMLVLTAYDFFYLQGGVARVVDSSTDLDHSHTCTVNCSSG